jgi:HCOMODA/2-hydroxy-3-carboxy-muconic semialdehyde decarboxylase
MVSDRLSLMQACTELARANRILAHEQVIDAFGHVSMRHPTQSDRYLISRHRACELVQPDDILELSLDSIPVKPTSHRLYGELVIHGCIYQARPDVQAVCHHHSAAVLPFCISDVPFSPVFHLGGTCGPIVPIWDSRTEFGDTGLVVIKPEEGRSLAQALGPHWMVLMRRHGATVVGCSVQDMVFRTIFTARNAEVQSRAQAMGKVEPLNSGEIEKCFAFHQGPRPTERAWEYWSMRLRKSEAVEAMALHSLHTLEKEITA